MSIYIHKSHNVSVLLYHLVCVAKYRQIIFDNKVDTEIKNICLDLEKRYQIHFLEIGTDRDHIHFLIQSIPTYSPTKITRTVKSLIAREILRRIPEVRKELWGAEFWTDGYFINTVGRKGNEKSIENYIKNQGLNTKYVQIHKDQIKLF